MPPDAAQAIGFDAEACEPFDISRPEFQRGPALLLPEAVLPGVFWKVLAQKGFHLPWDHRHLPDPGD
jgi:hypothetical protein